MGKRNSWGVKMKRKLFRRKKVRSSKTLSNSNLVQIPAAANPIIDVIL